MKIVVAKTAGFCMGVRRAVELVLDLPKKYPEPIYTYGPLIHNPQVLALLEEKGIYALKEIPEKGSGTVLIRAHGVPPEVKKRLQASGLVVVDASCPRVIKVQTIIRKYALQGYACIIIGDRDHPEVVGLLGYAGTHGVVAADLKALSDLPRFEQAIVVAQTTQNTGLFENVHRWVNEHVPHYKVFNTICDSTEKRQTEVSRLAEAVDAVVVVGGKNSGNTQRLLEIARGKGKTAFHVETEAELDDALAKAQQVGITAGASTPNWVLRRVYRGVQTLPFRKGKGWRRRWFTLERTLLLTSTYLALGAGATCYASARLQDISVYFPHILIAVLYVQSMHILNNLIGRKADRYNEPDRASFYDGHKGFLSLLAVLAGGAGLLAAYSLGTLPFLVLFAMSLTGLSYNLNLLPAGIGRRKYRRIRDIPGSKTVLIALAWGIVTSVFPALTTGAQFTAGSIAAVAWAAGLVFIRTAFFDILDMQGDRIVGKETLPILIGEKKTMNLLKGMLAAIMVLLAGSAALGLLTSLGYLLLLPAVSLFIVMITHEKGHMLPGVRLEFLVDTHFIMGGLLAGIWALGTG